MKGLYTGTKLKVSQKIYSVNLSGLNYKKFNNGVRKMKKIFLALTLCISLFSYSDEVNLYNAASKKEIINIPYIKDNIYKIYVKPLHQTVITFGGEIIEYSETGDNISFNTIEDKHSVRIKVVDENLNTDLVVKTNENIYYFKVQSTYDSYNPMINFLYPQKEVSKKRNYEKTTEPLSLINLDELNNDYTISKKYSWTPAQIFDDGTKTYLVMPQKMQELPVFLIREDGDYALVTFRIKETENGLKIYIVDRLFKEGVLKLGKKTVVIKNKKFKF